MPDPFEDWLKPIAAKTPTIDEWASKLPPAFPEQEDRMQQARQYIGQKRGGDKEFGFGLGLRLRRQDVQLPFQGVANYIARGIGGVENPAVAMKKAEEAYAEGKATDNQLALLASRDYEVARDKSLGTAAAIGKGVAHAAPIVSEALVGGAAVKGAAGAVGLGSSIAPAATTGGRMLQSAGIQAAATPLTPGLWFEESQQRAAENGGSWMDPKNVAAPMVKAAFQNAIMGHLGEGTKGLGIAKRVGLGAALMPAEQAGADALTTLAEKGWKEAGMDEKWATKTEWGTIGQFMKGESGEGWKALATQATMGALFAGFTGHKADPVGKLGEAVDSLAKEGVSKDKAAEIIQLELAKPPEAIANKAVKEFAESLNPEKPPESPTKPVAEGTPEAAKPAVEPEIVAPERRAEARLDAVDRRANAAERKRVADMTPEERAKELLTSQIVELPNRRAFDEAGPAKAVAMSDADGLKAFNDAFGYEAGNGLLRAKAMALKEAGLDAYHEKGDEFLYRSDDPKDLAAKMEKAREILKNTEIVATLSDGTVRTFKGADFSYGVGDDLSKAEGGLKGHKAEREAKGERKRGELRGITEVRPGRENLEGPRQPAEETGQVKEQPQPEKISEPTRKFPPVEENYSRPLKDFGDRVYRETDIEQFEDFMPFGRSSSDMPFAPEVHLSATENLALGQGKNRGVMIEFEPGTLKALVNTKKPGWKVAYEQGEAEFIARANPSEFKKNVVSFTIKPDAEASKTYKLRMKNTLRNAEEAGWTKETVPDGSIKYTRPGATSEPTQPIPSPEQRVEPEFGKPLTPQEQRTGQLAGGSPDAPAPESNPMRETALANAKVDAERVENNLPPLMAAARKANVEVWDAAMAKLEKDPNLSARLVDELAAKSRATTVEENALLLNRKIRLNNEYERIIRQASDSMQKSDVSEFDRLSGIADEMLGQIDKLDKVARSTGTEWGQAGQFRRQLAAEDFSLSRMMNEAIRQKRSPLTPEEQKKIVDLNAEITRLNRIIADLEEAGAANAGKISTKPKIDGMDATEAKIKINRAKRDYNEMIGAFTRANRTTTRKVLDTAIEANNALRAFITSLDLSAFFRQGGMLTLAHPIKAAKAFPGMLRSFKNRDYFERAEMEIRERPNARFGNYDRAGLYLADDMGPLSKQEEAFMGRTVGKIHGVAGSSRAFNGYLNRMRADVFDAMVDTLSRDGKATHEEMAAIANYINKATGRGTLGKFDNAAAGLAQVFFSPRYLASRFQIMSGQPFFGGNWRTRKLIAKEYGKALIGLGLVYATAKMLDNDTEITFDPRSADFGKMKFGRTRVDPLAGFSQLTAFGTRMVWGETKSTDTGKVTNLRDTKYGQQTTGDVFLRFLRNKLAPLPGYVSDYFVPKYAPSTTGIVTEATGKPKGIKGKAAALADKFIPISINDVYDAMREQGMPRGPAIALLAILGMGTMLHERQKK